MSDRLVYFQPDLPGIPEDLLLARDAGEVLFLTGAGVSTPPPSNLPDFGGLVIEIYRRMDKTLADRMKAFDEAEWNSSEPTDWKTFSDDISAKQRTELKAFASRQYDVVLGMLERRMSSTLGGVSGMRAVAAEVLNAATKTNALHGSLDRLARRYGELFVATTNFDRLHELQAGSATVRGFGLNALPRPSRKEDFHGVFHIHGVLPETVGDPVEIVLSDQDFGDVYLRRRIASDFIYDVTRIFRLVIIGYSLNDAPFRYLINAVAGDGQHFPDLKTRYAIVPRIGDDDTVAEEWEARSIKPVCYDKSDGHRQLQDLMAAWAASTPEPGEDRWARGELKAMCGRSHADASDQERSVFGYLIRRSTGLERGRLMGFLGEIRATPDWIDAANEIARDLDRTP